MCQSAQLCRYGSWRKNICPLRLYSAKLLRLIISVADPQPRFQCQFGSGIVGHCGSGSRVLMTKIDKIYSKNIYFLDQKCNLLIPWPPYRTSKLQEKPSALKREQPALQNFYLFFYFSGLFLPSCTRIRTPNSDPDPADQNQCESGSRKAVYCKYFIQHCFICRPLGFHCVGGCWY